MKNKLVLIAGIAFALLGCHLGNDKKAAGKREGIPDTVSTSGRATDSAKTVINPSIIWTVNSELGKEKLSPPINAALDTFSSAHLIELINENFPDIHLDFIKVSHDTMFVKIPDSQKLTQGIGDSGAENYLASVTYTLTEHKNIKFVNLAMKPGDHAEPGVYCREDFKRLQ